MFVLEPRRKPGSLVRPFAAGSTKRRFVPDRLFHARFLGMRFELTVD
jgi:hypothetical protein